LPLTEDVLIIICRLEWNTRFRILLAEPTAG
jgi:hypothetical protein